MFNPFHDLAGWSWKVKKWWGMLKRGEITESEYWDRIERKK